MNKKKVNVSAGLRTSAESQEASLNKEWFLKNSSSWESKMENFPKYVRRQNLTRFMVLYEIFKKVIDIKGSVIECGVNNGYGVMTWSKLSAILEPVNLTRKIYGFDTFQGFPGVSDEDLSESSDHVKKGDLATDSLFSHTKYQKKEETLNLHSTTFSNKDEKNSTFIVGGWHGQWSKFYYLKKYNGFFVAFLKCIPNVLMNLAQILPYILLDPTKAKYKYFKIEGFLCSLVGMSSFKRSKFDKKYIFKKN